jgi:hypothetical protein
MMNVVIEERMKEKVTYSFNGQDRAVKNYYPFGMLQPGLCYNSEDYLFGFIKTLSQFESTENYHGSPLESAPLRNGEYHE